MVAPPRSTAAISSARRVKSAERMDGAISTMIFLRFLTAARGVRRALRNPLDVVQTLIVGVLPGRFEFRQSEVRAPVRVARGPCGIRVPRAAGAGVAVGRDPRAA